MLASVIMENVLRGRDRAVWVTASPFLAEQIRRDCRDVGLRARIFELSQVDTRNRNTRALGPGLMICTYSTLIRTSQRGPSRLEQLLCWLGGEDWVSGVEWSERAINRVE